MKGMVFVELLNMAEQAMGPDMVDDVLDHTTLASGGAYTTVGNYPCAELVKLVGAFSERADVPPDRLQHQFGGWMFTRFAELYPDFFADKNDGFGMLEAIEDEIHVEVRKLYPEAELPRFDTERLAEDKLRLTYRSPRPLVHFCHGLIDACLEHFQQKAETTMEDRSSPEQGVAVFTIQLAG